MSERRSADRYHHGDLRNALIDAATALAREGGPDAVVLREVARRVGVSSVEQRSEHPGRKTRVDEIRKSVERVLERRRLRAEERADDRGAFK